MRKLIVFNSVTADGYFIKKKLPLQRTKTRTFENGNVLLCYKPSE